MIEGVGVFLAGHEGETGRAPGTLAYSNSAVGFEFSGDLADLGLRPRAAVLGGSEVATHKCLDLGNGAAESGNVLLHQRGGGLHQDEVRKVRGRHPCHRRKCCESAGLTVAMHAGGLRVEDQQNAPAFGQRRLDQDRRRRIGLAFAAVDDEAAVVEGGDANRRALAAVGQCADQIERAGYSTQAHGRGCNRQCQLGARAKSRMGGNGALDGDVVGARQAEAVAQTGKHVQCAITLETARRIARSSTDGDTGRGPVDGEADTAVGSPQLAVQVEETEVQAGWRGDAQGRGLGRISHREILVVVGAEVHKGHRTILWMMDATNQDIEGKLSMSQEREKPMAEAEVKAWLQENLPKWRLEDGWIRRTYKTASWKGTLMVINTIGHLAEAAWHHPDLTASYAWVEVRLVTHSAKGITAKDLALAAKIEEVVTWQPGTEGKGLEGTPQEDMRFAYIKYD